MAKFRFPSTDGEGTTLDVVNERQPARLERHPIFVANLEL